MTETLILLTVLLTTLALIGVALHDAVTDRPGRRHEPPRSHPRDPFAGTPAR